MMNFLLRRRKKLTSNDYNKDPKINYGQEEVLCEPEGNWDDFFSFHKVEFSAQLEKETKVKDDHLCETEQRRIFGENGKDVGRDLMPET